MTDFKHDTNGEKIKLPFIGIKLPFFSSQSYRFCEKVTVVMKVTVFVDRKLPFWCW